MIKARKLPGFRDFFAQDVQIRQYVIDTFKMVFEKYGYEPLETPALEYTDIFAGESGSEAEKLFFRFSDQGDRNVMLKYEVMISMCRAVAENINNIPLPYKRYQIQNVWRAEKPQKGRYREFTQCDADTIGSGSVAWDAEFIQMGIEVLTTLGFDKFRANISNRKFLNGLVLYAGGSQEEFIPICLSIDKLPKIGREKVVAEMTNLRKIKAEVAAKILDIITVEGETRMLINTFQEKMRDIPVALEGLKELDQIFTYLEKSGVKSEYYGFAPFIARGLAYYTGPIWEFEIFDGDVGSVAGCGRYDNTIGRFLGRNIPATGGSFGIERIVEVIKERKLVNFNPTTTLVIVTIFNSETFYASLDIANFLRQNGIKTLLYSDPDRLDKQLKYADKKGIPYVVIQGPEEAAKNQVTLKNMTTGKQQTAALKEIVDILKQQIA